MAAPPQHSNPPNQAARAVGQALAAAVAGAVGAAVVHYLASGGRSGDDRLVIGGVDVTGIRPGQTFIADFSVDPAADAMAKRQALMRLDTAYRAFSTNRSAWYCAVQADTRLGRYLLHITALPGRGLTGFVVQ